MTRPLGEVYFAYPVDSPYLGGPSMNFASSPDALHWKPFDAPGIRRAQGIGGATPASAAAPRRS